MGCLIHFQDQFGIQSPELIRIHEKLPLWCTGSCSEIRSRNFPKIFSFASKSFQQSLHGRNITSVNGITHKHRRGSVVDILIHDKSLVFVNKKHVYKWNERSGTMLIERKAVKRGAQQMYCLVHL